MKILANRNFNKNEIQNAVIHPLNSDPSSPVTGQFYFNTVNGKVHVYSGSFKALVYSGAISNGDIASDAAIALDKLAVNPIARANHTGTQTAATISDFDTQVRTSRLDQMAAPTAAVSMNSQRITNVDTPTAGTDAANKTYVDSVAVGLRDFKDSVRVATTANITLSGTQSIDGISVVANDRVLVKNQTDSSQNGIYVVSAGAWSRATDADTSAKVTSGMYLVVEEGSTQGGDAYVLSTANPITLGTTPLSFTVFTSGGDTDIVDGAGLTFTGSTLNIGTASSSRIVVNADNIDLASGVIATPGTYQSVTVDTYGRVTAGTNPTTLAGYGITDGVKKYTALIGNGSATTITITQATHGLAANSSNIVAVYEVSTNDEVECDVNVASSSGDVALTFSVAPATNSLRVVIVG